MADATSVSTRYRLSFSVGGLFLQGASIGAGLYLELRDWRAVRAAIDADNLLQARTVALRRSSRRCAETRSSRRNTCCGSCPSSHYASWAGHCFPRSPRACCWARAC